MTGLRKICDERDLMLVLDEVRAVWLLRRHSPTSITGHARLLASAKGIGGGFPMGRASPPKRAAAGMVIARTDRPMVGNPFAMAAGRRCSTSSPTTSSWRGPRDRRRLRAALEAIDPQPIDGILTAYAGLA